MITLVDVRREVGSFIVRSANAIPPEFRARVFERRDEFAWHQRDLVTPLEKGLPWLLEETAKHQPRTAALLASGSGLALAIEKSEGVMHGYLVTELPTVGVVEICRGFHGSNPSDPGYRPLPGERHSSLPEPIRAAYYHRFDGLNLPAEPPPFGIHTRLMPFPIHRPWKSIDRYLGELRLAKRWLPFIEEAIPGARPEDKDMPWTSFMMFLDSRPTLAGREGDVLFVKNHVQDGVVYHIRDADVGGMRSLAEPAEAIDRYCEHVLLGRADRFDFRPFTTGLG